MPATAGMPATPTTVGGAGCTASADPVDELLPRRVRRLTPTEYETIISGVLGRALPLEREFSPEPSAQRVDRDGELLVVSSSHLDRYQSLARRLSAAPEMERLAACTNGETGLVCAVSFARRLARRLFGRPLTASEVTRLGAVYQTAGADGHARGVQLLAQALLIAPQFLYATELGEATAPGPVVHLTPHEIASQLALAVAGARPDDALIAAAEQGKLADGSERRRQAERLVGGPLGRAQLRHFFTRWLGTTEVEHLEKDMVQFSFFSPQAMAGMKREVDLFVDHSLWDGGSGTLGELFTRSVSFPDTEVVNLIYKQDARSPAAADGSKPVTLDPTRRKGLLSLPAFLASHAGIDTSNPVERGLAVRQTLLCQPIPPPPDGILANPITNGDKTRTTREKFAQHAADPKCVPCHSQFDPIGFGMEGFDAVGRHRTMDNGKPVDASGALKGTDVDGPFQGPAQLSEMLARSSSLRDCFVSQLGSYLEARGSRPAGACGRKALRDRLTGSGDRVAQVVLALVEREAFIQRRAAP